MIIQNWLALMQTCLEWIHFLVTSFPQVKYKVAEHQYYVHVLLFSDIKIRGYHVFLDLINSWKPFSIF